jgi:hypothetical protein
MKAQSFLLTPRQWVLGEKPDLFEERLSNVRELPDFSGEFGTFRYARGALDSDTTSTVRHQH